MKNFTCSLPCLFIGYTSLLFLFTSCNKQESPIIPEYNRHGPEITVGPTGSHGSSTYDLRIITPYYDDNGEVEILFPPITQNILDKGAVLTFWKSPDGWKSLPTTHISSAGQVHSLTFRTAVSRLTLHADSNTTGPNLFTGAFRVVVVPIPLGKGNGDLDACNYEAVMEELGIVVR